MKYCRFHVYLLLTIVGEPCSMDGDVRLVNGQDETQGRVEFCYDGVWGTVCDNQWDNNDARVVCRQLGLNESTLTSHSLSSINTLILFLFI